MEETNQLSLLPAPVYTILEGDCRETLRLIEPGSVQCVVTSPPYFGLRDYGTATWEGGSSECEHKAPGNNTKTFGNPEFNKNRPSREATKTSDYFYKDVCKDCGACRTDHQIGLESSINEYVESLAKVFDLVWDTLREDGTVWLNLGDSYAGSSGNYTKNNTNLGQKAQLGNKFPKVTTGLRPKNLMGIPWRVAFALQDRGWILRSAIVWQKGNPMPESVKDRPTKSYEMVFLLAKSEGYYYHGAQIKETSAQDSNEERNARDVWLINPRPYKGAHFATMPEELVRRCVLTGSPPGSLVLDPFTGSGTTGMVAVKHGREFVGCELNPEYIELAKKRISEGK